MATAVDPGELERLRARLSSLELLVGTISHALKGQLTGVDGGMYLLNSGAAKNDPERMKKGAAMVQRNLGRVRGTVLNVLYYARDRDPLVAPVSAPDLVQGLTETLQKTAAEAGVAFSAEIVPGTGEFEADPRALNSLLVNLLDQALEACGADPEDKRHWCRLSVSQEEGQVVLSVQDNGRGMDPETREKVLNPLFTAKIEGAGLGVFIAAKVARAHGGNLEVASAPGGGNVYTVRIPGGPAARGEPPLLDCR